MPDSSAGTSSDTSVDRRSAHFGIVCTHSAEIRPLLDRLDRPRRYTDNGAVFRGGFLEESIRVALVEAGPGFAQHRAAAQTLVDEHNPSWVFAVGFSSSLTSDLQSGDLSLASEICDTHGNSLTVECRIPESKRVLVRRHVVADHHPGKVQQRRDLAEDTGAAVVDTTSLAVAQMCQPADDDEKHRNRFLSIRGIVGDPDTDLTDKVVSHLFEPETDRRHNLLSRLRQRFSRDPELRDWDSAASTTAINLNRYLLSLIRQLAEKMNVH